MSTGIYLKKSFMTPDQVLQWLIEFGSGWVNARTLMGTWADTDLYWADCAVSGWLEIKDNTGEHGLDDLRLTDKALQLLKESRHE
jgi:hypothetical protein